MAKKKNRPAEEALPPEVEAAVAEVLAADEVEEEDMRAVLAAEEELANAGPKESTTGSVSAPTATTEPVSTATAEVASTEASAPTPPSPVTNPWGQGPRPINWDDCK